jgi:hypothetical protein
VINKFTIGSDVLCSNTSPFFPPEDVLIYEPKLPVCRLEPASLATGKITCLVM